MATSTKTPNIPAIAAAFYRGAVECAIYDSPDTMRLTYSDGSVLSVARTDLDRERTWETLAWHGLKQKLVDAAAISRDPETGRAATIDTKKRAVAEVHERLLAGQWNKVREGVATGGLLLSALIRMYDGRKTREELEVYLSGKTDAEKAALRVNPKVAAIIEAIKAERAITSGTDSNALLAELDGE